MTTTDPRRVPHTGPGHASGDPGWCEGCAAELAADRAEKEARAAPPTAPYTLLPGLLADVDPADWFSKDELVGMLEHHGADPDRIVPDALLMYLAPAMAAAIEAVLDRHPRDKFDQCGTCREPEDDHWGIPYPCADVRAITSALGSDRG